MTFVLANSTPVSSPLGRRGLVRKPKCMPGQKVCPLYGITFGGSIHSVAGYDCVDVRSDLEYVRFSFTAFTLSVYTVPSSDLVVAAWMNPEMDEGVPTVVETVAQSPTLIPCVAKQAAVSSVGSLVQDIRGSHTHYKFLFLQIRAGPVS